jgi:hypothetical protein
VTNPDLGAAVPLTLDQIDLDEHHGVKAGSLGADHDMGIAVFTHDRRRALAAANSLLRSEWGHHTIGVTASKAVWWLVVDNCGCGPVCPHEPDEAGDREHHNCATYGLPPCIEEVFSWMGLTCDEGTPGALPVTVIEVDL